MKEILKLTVNGNPEYISIMKINAKAVASKLGFDVEKVDEIEMSVAEACKLMTCHNSECWKNSYTISYSFKDNKELLIEVYSSDEGTIDKEGHCCCGDCPNEGELAIHVIESLMDFVSMENVGLGDFKIIMGKDI